MGGFFGVVVEDKFFGADEVLGFAGNDDDGVSAFFELNGEAELEFGEVAQGAVEDLVAVDEDIGVKERDVVLDGALESERG